MSISILCGFCCWLVTTSSLPFKGLLEIYQSFKDCLCPYLYSQRVYYTLPSQQNPNSWSWAHTWNCQHVPTLQGIWRRWPWEEGGGFCQGIPDPASKFTAMTKFYVSTSSFNMLFLINSIVSSSWFSSARFKACRNAFFALENSPIMNDNLILKRPSHYSLSTN